MTKEDYMRLPKERLAELLAERDSLEETIEDKIAEKFAELLSKQPLHYEQPWISVEEALPEEKFDNGYEFVFVIVKIDEETSYYDTDYIRNGKWELHDADEVTHWMPIPQLKGGKDE